MRSLKLAGVGPTRQQDALEDTRRRPLPAAKEGKLHDGAFPPVMDHTPDVGRHAGLIAVVAMEWLTSVSGMPIWGGTFRDLDRAGDGPA